MRMSTPTTANKAMATTSPLPVFASALARHAPCCGRERFKALPRDRLLAYRADAVASVHDPFQRSVDLGHCVSRVAHQGLHLCGFRRFLGRHVPPLQICNLRNPIGTLFVQRSPDSAQLASSGQNARSGDGGGCHGNSCAGWCRRFGPTNSFRLDDSTMARGACRLHWPPSVEKHRPRLPAVGNVADLRPGRPKFSSERAYVQKMSLGSATEESWTDPPARPPPRRRTEAHRSSTNATSR
jgi:hypothetical protein